MYGNPPLPTFRWGLELGEDPLFARVSKARQNADFARENICFDVEPWSQVIVIVMVMVMVAPASCVLGSFTFRLSGLKPKLGAHLTLLVTLWVLASTLLGAASAQGSYWITCMLRTSLFEKT